MSRWTLAWWTIIDWLDDDLNIICLMAVGTFGFLILAVLMGWTK